ncbi:MAG TPA: hypothetical protein VF066_16555 [Thermoleophilaceae bacterium]
MAWRVEENAGGSFVTLCATIDAAGPVDRMVLHLGGHRRPGDRRVLGALCDQNELDHGILGDAAKSGRIELETDLT